MLWKLLNGMTFGLSHEVKRHGLRKGLRTWFTWASVEDIEVLTVSTARRRKAYKALRLERLLADRS